MWWQNLDPSVYIAVILIGIILVLAVEAFRHYRTLKSIKYRIHVNGTRGKSSVARLIAAGLRAGGLITCAKTTGTLARFIFPDGSEEPIYRMGHNNILEQIGVVRKAAKHKSDALVIECMALQPLLQALCEKKLVQSTHGVCTNARPDHLDVMGPLEEDVALALAGTMTYSGDFYTCEQKHLKIFQMAADDRGTTLHPITPALAEQITDQEINQFSYKEFKENVALALSVCEAIGVKRDVALKGMWEAMPDPGAMSIYEVEHNGHTVCFANAFAANDPVSTTTLWEKLLKDFKDCDDYTLVVNCRGDRHERTAQMAEAVLDWTPPTEIILIGTGTDTYTYTSRKVSTPKTNKLNISDGSDWKVEEILSHITRDPTPKKHLVVGVCNIANIGLELIEYFRTYKDKSSC